MELRVYIVSKPNRKEPESQKKKKKNNPTPSQPGKGRLDDESLTRKLMGQETLGHHNNLSLSSDSLLNLEHT